MKPKNIDDYIASFPPETAQLLEQIRSTVKRAAPNARETISYNMPAFELNGILVYFAAFKRHIGLYPPIRGNAKLQKLAAPYTGEKGSLKFPLSTPIPYELIEQNVKLRAKQNAAAK